MEDGHSSRRHMDIYGRMQTTAMKHGLEGVADQRTRSSSDTTVRVHRVLLIHIYALPAKW